MSTEGLSGKETHRRLCCCAKVVMGSSDDVLLRELVADELGNRSISQSVPWLYEIAKR